MKYRVLLIGRNKIMIEDMFQHSDEKFELQTSSMRYADITSHLGYFKPHAVFFCMNKDEKERTAIVASLRDRLKEDRAALVLIGDQKECEEFKNANGGMGDLLLKKPISARNIYEKAALFLNERITLEEKDPLQSACDIADELIHQIGKDENLSHIARKVEETAEAYRQEEEAVQRLKEIAAAAQKQKEAAVAQKQEAAAQQEAENAQKQQVEAAVQRLKETAAQQEAPVKKHVLVVDDDPMMLKLIKEQLKDAYTVATAINGAIALKFLESKKTDLILLDYEMPGENGAQVLEKVRNNPVTAKLPVVFLTGIKDREKIKRVVQLKPQGYLLKPIDREALLNSIKNVIG